MIKKHSILFSLLLALILLSVATAKYPGGSEFDKMAIGFDWQHNYLCNLFDAFAVNGELNGGRFWAIGGMFAMCLAFALFFIFFAVKIPVKSAALIIRYFGASAMLFGFLAVTPIHNAMITIASMLSLVSMFYITVYIFKSRLLLFKCLSIACLLVAYLCNYIYYTQHYLEYLAVFQKISLVFAIVWMLGLNYFTQKEDFAHIKK